MRFSRRMVVGFFCGQTWLGLFGVSVGILQRLLFWRIDCFCRRKDLEGKSEDRRKGKMTGCIPWLLLGMRIDGGEGQRFNRTGLFRGNK
ncbi:hypothetical protein QUC31_001314 [Theobroma cacao]